VVLVLALAAALVAGGAATRWYGLAGPAASGACPPGTTIQGSGASFPASLLSTWVRAFDAAHSVTVNYAPSGALQGITYLTEKLKDFAVTDEGLNGSERAALTSAVGPVLTLPILAGAVAIVYQLPGAPQIELTGSELAAIYLGNITNWGDPTLVANNPVLAGMDLTITTVHRTDPAGMTYVLTSLLTDDSSTWAGGSGLGRSSDPAWPSAARQLGAAGNTQMVADVQSVSGAIGYTDLYDARAKALPTAAIVNPTGHAIAPSVGSVEAAISDLYAANAGTYPGPTGDWSSVSWVNGPGATDYPLTTLVYLMVPADPSRGYTPSLDAAQVLVAWLTFVLTTGQGFNESAFPFVPPPSAFVSDSLAAVGAMTYGGQSIPRCA
jgi:phosphate transport system substrate-binding protein